MSANWIYRQSLINNADKIIRLNQTIQYYRYLLSNNELRE